MECKHDLPNRVLGKRVKKTVTTIHASSTRQVVVDVFSVSMPTRPSYHVLAVMYVNFQDGEGAYGTEQFCRKCLQATHPEILEALTCTQTDWV
jgi:hypothetical protein